MPKIWSPQVIHCYFRGHNVNLRFKIGWIEIPGFIDSLLCDYLLWFLTWNNILCMCCYNTIYRVNGTFWYVGLNKLSIPFTSGHTHLFIIVVCLEYGNTVISNSQKSRFNASGRQFYLWPSHGNWLYDIRNLLIPTWNFFIETKYTWHIFHPQRVNICLTTRKNVHFSYRLQYLEIPYS